MEQNIQLCGLNAVSVPDIQSIAFTRQKRNENGKPKTETDNKETAIATLVEPIAIARRTKTGGVWPVERGDAGLCRYVCNGDDANSIHPEYILLP